MKAAFVALALAFCAAALQSNADECATDKWITLGTLGGPNVDPDVAQIANALVVENSIYLFDTPESQRDWNCWPKVPTSL